MWTECSENLHITDDECEGTEQIDELSSAFLRVGLMADLTWWRDKDYSDGYKMANLWLWNEAIHSERLASSGSSPEKPAAPEKHRKQSPDALQCAGNHEKPTNGNHVMFKKDVILPTCGMEAAQMQRALTSMDPTVPAPLAQSAYTDTRCILNGDWPLTLLKTYPAFINTLENPSSRSVFSQKHAEGFQKDENTLPYSVMTVEELAIHQKIVSPAVKNLWTDGSEKISFNKSKGADWSHGLNANVPEFYPSVLLPPRQWYEVDERD